MREGKEGYGERGRGEMVAVEVERMEKGGRRKMDEHEFLLAAKWEIRAKRTVFESQQSVPQNPVTNTTHPAVRKIIVTSSQQRGRSFGLYL